MNMSQHKSHGFTRPRLHALLPRLLQLAQGTGVTAGMKAKWTALSKRLPPLPVGDVNNTHIEHGLMPGKMLPASVMNAENAELYAIHPYRVMG